MALRYLLDTNICIYIRQKRPPNIQSRFAKLSAGEAAISVITHGELAYGAAKSGDTKAANTALARFVSLVPVLSPPESAGDLYGTVRSHLAQRGQLIGPNDLWIAAHALSAGLTLVTNNEREFRRVPDLKIENWAK